MKRRGVASKSVHVPAPVAASRESAAVFSEIEVCGALTRHRYKVQGFKERTKSGEVLFWPGARLCRPDQPQPVRTELGIPELRLVLRTQSRSAK